MELEVQEYSKPALIGVIFTNRVIYNIVEEDTDFNNTGLCLIEYINRNKTEFVYNMIKAQLYDSIKYILNDKIVFSEFYDLNNENRVTLKEMMNLINKDNVYEYFYFLDLESNSIIIKVPELDKIYALDYTNKNDVDALFNVINNFINN